MIKNTNRPLSPHLTIYTPQLTSTLSIFHRISGAFLASSLLACIWFFQCCSLTFTYYQFYWCVLNLITYLFDNSLFFGFSFLLLVALCYHMSNGIRHLFWDFGFFLDLSKVYASGIAMLLCACLLTLIYILRVFVF
jgi:succinate dehydrogenase / fumarate reductase, cytochrome b subunit